MTITPDEITEIIHVHCEGCFTLENVTEAIMAAVAKPLKVTMRTTEDQIRKLAEKLFRSIDSGAYSEYQVGDAKDIDMIATALLYVARTEAADCDARVAAMREKCFEFVQSGIEKVFDVTGIGHEILGGTSDVIRGISFPTPDLDALVLKARREEAEWWHRMWQGCEFERHVCDPDNRICQRLAALSGEPKVEAVENRIARPCEHSPKYSVVVVYNRGPNDPPGNRLGCVLCEPELAKRSGIPKEDAHE